MERRASIFAACGMTDHTEDTVENLIALQRQHAQKATRSQRLTNRITRTLGSPLAIVALSAAVIGWVAGNYLAVDFHVHALEEMPFPDLALVLGFFAVLVALLILSTQRHDEALAQKRADLTLQIALLSERKVAKVIALLEEQRRDNPLLPARSDAEAEQMAQAADPTDTLSRLEAAQPDRS